MAVPQRIRRDSVQQREHNCWADWRLHEERAGRRSDSRVQSSAFRVDQTTETHVELQNPRCEAARKRRPQNVPNHQDADAMGGLDMIKRVHLPM